MSLILGILDSGGAAVSASSYESIASATGTGSSGTITFGSIPSTYKHLQIRGICRDTNTLAGAVIQPFYMRFNSDTGNNYADHTLFGDGSGAFASLRDTSATYITLYNTNANGAIAANIMGVSITDIHDYTSTSKNKTIRWFSGMDDNAGNTESRVTLGSGLWMNSSNAVTSITLTAVSNFATTTQFALYGIKG
jgi:hypothetical protein